jgi:hypothetical protein
MPLGAAPGDATVFAAVGANARATGVVADATDVGDGLKAVPDDSDRMAVMPNAMTIAAPATTAATVRGLRRR